MQPIKRKHAARKEEVGESVFKVLCLFGEPALTTYCILEGNISLVTSQHLFNI